MSNYPNLFSPITVRGTTFKNRIIMPPMGTATATFNGMASDMLINYYTERAKGGAGLITIEAAAVTFNGIGWGHNVGIYLEEHVPGLKKLTDSIHAAGAKASLEIFHSGRKAPLGNTILEAVGPSALPGFRGTTLPRELTIPEIEVIIGEFVTAAKRAKAAGFDAVNLHCAHGYLLLQFLSPISNVRTDAYGGSTENRARIAVEILQGIRKEVGEDFPVFCRLSCDEQLNEGVGITPEEGQAIAKLLEAAGADVIDVSVTGSNKGFLTCEPTYTTPFGLNRELSKMIRSAVNVPVTCVGKINTPALAEEILANGEADMICMGRELIADPYLPIKAMEGREDEIAPCIHCMQGCIGRFGVNNPISCTVNPETSREGNNPWAKVATPKNVLVVGGGVSGMNAARLLAKKGHKVTLMEKAGVLGGQALLAATPQHKVKQLTPFIEYLKGEVAREGVNVVLNTAFTKDAVATYGAEVVVQTTGANPVKFGFPGCESILVQTAWETLREKNIKNKKVVVIGAGEVGLETAEFLVQNGNEVLVFEMLPSFGNGMELAEKYFFFERLRPSNIDIRPDTKVTGFDGNKVLFEIGGVPMSIDGIDAAVLAVGSRPNPLPEMEDLGVPVVNAGDTVKIGRLYEAMTSSYNAALTI